MTNKIYKRTYRVAFHPNVVKMIEGAKRGECVMWGYHDLIDHNHEDDEFQYRDIAFQEFFESRQKYNKKFDNVFKKHMKELAERQGWSTKDLKRISKELDDDQKRRDEEHKLASQRINEIWDSGKVDYDELFSIMGSSQKQLFDDYDKQEKKVRKKFKAEGRLTYNQIEQKSYEYAFEVCGDGPRGYHGLDPEGNAPIWQPIFDRGYWEFEHISSEVPDWISHRDYSIVDEQLYEPEPEKLKRKEGSQVSWMSRNKGGKVRVSSSNFRKDTKEYPPHLNPGV